MFVLRSPQPYEAAHDGAKHPRNIPTKHIPQIPDIFCEPEFTPEAISPSAEQD